MSHSILTLFSVLSIFSLPSFFLPYVIYKSPKNSGPKNVVFLLFFHSKTDLKPLYIVVNFYYLPSKPLFVIRTILSTCLEQTISMPPRPSSSLADTVSFNKSMNNILSLVADILKKFVVIHPDILQLNYFIK